MISQAISLKPKLEQNLKITPAMIQHLEMLQLNQIELENYINSELESNPLLELDEKKKLDSEELAAYFKSIGTSKSYSHSDEVPPEPVLVYRSSLAEHLLTQLGLLKLSKRDFKIARLIIAHINRLGYMDSSLEQISANYKVPLFELEASMALIQTFEPAGVAARNLSECLLLQLDPEDADYNPLKLIVSEQLELLAANKLAVMAKQLSLPLSKLQTLIAKIKHLNPKPGACYDAKPETNYIVPDIVVDIVDGKFKVEILDLMSPKLVLSSEYRSMLENSEDLESREFLTEKLNKALLLLKNIEQRRQTLVSVVEMILEFQRDFFFGATSILPLNLKQISEKLKVHESTVSRAIRAKYLSSPFGIYSLKFFFSNNKLQSEESSTLEIKHRLKALIDAEIPNKPYSDQKLAVLLSSDGINIARRTVAKYREELKIKSSSLRKVHN